MATIAIQNIVLGGIGDSDYFGSKESVSRIVGFDLHSYPGKMIVNQKLTKESGTTIDDLVRARVSCSDGSTYFFGSTNGKIWKRTSGGTYSLEATASPAAGSAGVLDAAEYDGYVYYAMQSRLGRWQIGTAWSTRNDSYATFTNTSTLFHPMKVLNGILYIGDGNFVAQMETAFVPDALDILDPLIVSCLGSIDTDLLIGTYVNTNVMETQFLRWNTWSDSWSYSDPVPEVGINAFIEADNEVLVQAGRKGRIYAYNGLQLVGRKSVPGDFPRGTTNTCKVHSNAVFNFGGLPLFGLSQVSGNGPLYGIYSFGKHNAGYPSVLALEYVISQDKLTDIEIGCIVGVGDIFLVSWKDGSTYGIDKLDVSAKYSGAYVETRWAMANRREPLHFGQFDVAYAKLPTGTDISLYKQVDADTTFGTALASVKDATRMLKSSDTAIGDAVRARFKVSVTASANDAPEVEGIYIDVGEDAID